MTWSGGEMYVVVSKFCLLIFLITLIAQDYLVMQGLSTPSECILCIIEWILTASNFSRVNIITATSQQQVIQTAYLCSC